MIKIFSKRCQQCGQKMKKDDVYVMDGKNMCKDCYGSMLRSEKCRKLSGELDRAAEHRKSGSRSTLSSIFSLSKKSEKSKNSKRSSKKRADSRKNKAKTDNHKSGSKTLKAKANENINNKLKPPESPKRDVKSPEKAEKLQKPNETFSETTNKSSRKAEKSPEKVNLPKTDDETKTYPPHPLLKAALNCKSEAALNTAALPEETAPPDAGLGLRAQKVVLGYEDALRRQATALAQRDLEIEELRRRLDAVQGAQPTGGCRQKTDGLCVHEMLLRNERAAFEREIVELKVFYIFFNVFGIFIFFRI